METLSVYNDLVFSSHLAGLPREFGRCTPIQFFGHIPVKTHRCDARQPVDAPVCLSLVTQGDGAMRIEGRDVDFPIPCAFVQLPGLHYAYGPRTRWSESYMGFDMMREAFEKRWHLCAGYPLIWPIANIARVRDLIELEISICRRVHERCAADKADQIAEMIATEVFAGSPGVSEPASDDAAIVAAERFITENFTKPLRLDAVAERFSLSRRSFFRQWSQRFAMSPGDLLIYLRLEHARRQLLESSDDVKTIAREAGFASSFYFSRLFARRLGVSPAQYRKVNRR